MTRSSELELFYEDVREAIQSAEVLAVYNVETGLCFMASEFERPSLSLATMCKLLVVYRECSTEARFKVLG